MAPPMYGDKSSGMPSAWGKGKDGKGGKGGKGVGCISGMPPPNGWKTFAKVPDHVGFGGKARARGPPPGIDENVGDWPCPNLECANWNWAKRDVCGKCFTPHPCRVKEVFKPTYADKVQDRRAGLDTGRTFATGNGYREGSGGGYSEVDREAEYRKKRRREEEKQETAERKAAKTRCKSCKRYTCIC